MDTKTNSAIILNSIILQAYQNENKLIKDVWKDVFQIDLKYGYLLEKSIISCLDSLNDEFEFFKKDMEETNFSKELYINEISNLQKSLIVPTGINGDWEQRKKQITNVHFKIFDFCSEILPTNEEQIDSNDIKELKKLISELEDFIEKNSLPKDLKRILEQHISKIKVALYTYNINGINVFDEVLQSAYGEVIKNKNIFSDDSNNKVKEKIAKVWSHIQKIYKIVKGTEQLCIDFNNIQGL